MGGTTHFTVRGSFVLSNALRYVKSLRYRRYVTVQARYIFYIYFIYRLHFTEQAIVLTLQITQDLSMTEGIRGEPLCVIVSPAGALSARDCTMIIRRLYQLSERFTP